MGPVPKLYSSITESSPRASQKKSTPKVSVGCSQQTFFHRTQAQQGGVTITGSWRTKIVHSPGWCCKNRNARLLEGGIWVSSRLPYHKKTESHWFLPPNTRRPPLPTSGALGWEPQCGVETPYSAEETFAAKISVWILSWDTWVGGGQPFLCLCPSYQSLMWLLL